MLALIELVFVPQARKLGKKADALLKTIQRKISDLNRLTPKIKAARHDEELEEIVGEFRHVFDVFAIFDAPFERTNAKSRPGSAEQKTTGAPDDFRHLVLRLSEAYAAIERFQQGWRPRRAAPTHSDPFTRYLIQGFAALWSAKTGGPPPTSRTGAFANFVFDMWRLLDLPRFKSLGYRLDAEIKMIKAPKRMGVLVTKFRR